MATETETYKLKKPDEDDFYDIGQFNQTMDLIDESLRTVAERTVVLQSSLAMLQEELTQYTDTKVSELVGSAPEKLDTLEEVADALQKNDDVVTALTEAIGTKQSKLGIGTFKGNIDILGDSGLPQTSSICWCQSNVVTGTLPHESSNAYWFILETNVVLDNSSIRKQKATVWGQNENRVLERIFTNGEWYPWKEYLRTDGNLQDTTVTFTSGDNLNPTGWTAIGKIFSGAKLKDMLNGFSTAVKNLRFLWKLIGETDISKIGDGTLTGIVSQLNTDKMNRTWKTSTVSFEDCTKTGYLYGEEKFLDYFVVPKISLPENLGKFVSFVGTSYNGPMYCALTMIHGNGKYYGGIVFSYDPACTARQFRYSDGVYGFRTL